MKNNILFLIVGFLHSSKESEFDDSVGCRNVCVQTPLIRKSSLSTVQYYIYIYVCVCVWQIPLMGLARDLKSAELSNILDYQVVPIRT
jgi:hypothetical protein